MAILHGHDKCWNDMEMKMAEWTSLEELRSAVVGQIVA